MSLPLAITGNTQAPSYGLDMKSLTGRVQEQVQKKARETIDGLLKGTTKPEDVYNRDKTCSRGCWDADPICRNSNQVLSRGWTARSGFFNDVLMACEVRQICA